MTPSEQLVFDLCKRSFLSLWSYANPCRPNGKELCDALLVFGDTVVIFSVKEIALKEDADPEVAAARWHRKAIDASVDQLVGAKRQLASMTRVIRADGSDGIDLPSESKRRVHLVAVAAGANRTIEFAGGTRGNGEYVHVLDEVAVREIIGELDTAPDFIGYLNAKESFRGTFLCEGEEALLATYLIHGRTFPADLHFIVAQDGLWQEFCARPDARARKEADRVSFWWDENIERFVADHALAAEQSACPSDLERLVRVMAAEDRFARRFLSKACLEWLYGKQAGVRNFVSPSGVAYIFGTYPRDWTREARTTNLTNRCFVARSPSVTGATTVIGIGTEVYDPEGFSLDAVYLHMPEWAEEDERIAKEARERLGILANAVSLRLAVEEFPRQPSAKTERNRERRRRQGRR